MPDFVPREISQPVDAGETGFCAKGQAGAGEGALLRQQETGAGHLGLAPFNDHIDREIETRRIPNFWMHDDFNGCRRKDDA